MVGILVLVEEDHIRNGHVAGAVGIRDMAVVQAAAVDLEAVLVAIEPVAVVKVVGLAVIQKLEVQAMIVSLVERLDVVSQDVVARVVVVVALELGELVTVS